MPQPDPADLRLRVIPAIAEFDAAAWDACANPTVAAALQPKSEERNPTQCDSQVIPYNPFISYDFLYSLEASDSATARTGWQPQHMVAEAADGTVLGVVPCYLKSHSRGEYVFDRGWAEAYERAGGGYYPKLQVSVPFTPATGRRLLVRPSPSADRVRDGLIAGLLELCRERRGLLGPLHLPAGGRNARRWSGTASCTAPTSSSTGRTTATPPSTRSSRRYRPASARPSSASGATRSPPASPCTGSPART